MTYRLRPLTQPVQIKAPGNITTTVQSLKVDLRYWETAALDFLLGAATGLGDSNRLVITVKVADTEGGTYEAVPATDLDDVLPTFDSNDTTGKPYRVEYLGTKPFLLVDFAVTGTVSIPLSAMATLGGPRASLFGRPTLGL